MTTNTQPDICENRTFVREGLTVTLILPMKEFGGQLLPDNSKQPAVMGEMVAEGRGPNGQPFRQRVPFPIDIGWKANMGLSQVVSAAFERFLPSAQAAQEAIQQQQRDQAAGIIKPGGS